MADSTYQTLLRIAFEIENAPDLEAARAAVGRLLGEAKQADQAGAAFRELGLDIVQLRTGMSASEQTIVNALKTIATNAETTGTELRTSIVAALQQIHSPAGLQALESELRQLAIQGKLTAQEVRGFNGVTMDLTQRAGGSAASLRQMRAATTETGGAVSGLMTALKGLGLGYLAQQAAQAADGMTRLQAGFEAVFKSSEAAGRELDFVRAISNRLGTDLTGTAEAYLSLAAASQGTNLQGQRTREIFQAVSGAMAVLGKSSADTEGALEALSQMISKGSVQSEELRGQLGERLPGAFQLAAKAMGVSTAELSKMLYQGQILADDLLPKLAAELEKTYGGSAKQAESFAASFNRFWNSIKDVSSVTAESGVGGFFRTIIDGSTKAVTALETVPIAFDGIGTAVGNMAGAVASGTSVLDALSEAGKKTGSAIESMLAKMSGVPTAAQFAAEMNQKFADSLTATLTPLQKLQEAAKGNLQLLPADLKAIIEQLKATGDAATAAEAAFKKFASAPAQLGTADGVLQLATTIDLIRANATSAGTAISENLGKALEKLTTEQLANLGTQAQLAMDSIANNENARQAIIGLGQIVDTVATEAMRRLGIDGQEALTGIDAKMKEAMASMDILGKTAGISAQIIRQAFTDLIASANTQAELDALTSKLQQLGATGKLSAQDVAAGLMQIQTQAAIVAESLDPVQQMLNKIGIDGREAITGIDTEFQDMIGTLYQLIPAAEATGTALLHAVDKATEAATTRKELELVADAIRRMGEAGKLTGEQVTIALAAIAVESSKMIEATDAVTQAFKTLGIESNKELQAIADQAVLAFETLRNSGQASTGDLNAAFAAMAEKVLQAADAMGPLAEETAIWKLKAMAATDEQREALDKLIQKYAESGGAAKSAAGEQVEAANTAAAAIENYSTRVEARAGAGALAFQDTTAAITQQTSAINNLGGSQQRIIIGYNDLTEAAKRYATAALSAAAAADAQLAGTMNFRDETGKTIQGISGLISVEKKQAEQLNELKDAYENGKISIGSYKFQLSQLLLYLENPLTTAGVQAKKTIQQILNSFNDLTDSTQTTTAGIHRVQAALDNIDTSKSIRNLTDASNSMDQINNSAAGIKDLFGGMNNLNFSGISSGIRELIDLLKELSTTAGSSKNALDGIAQARVI